MPNRCLMMSGAFHPNTASHGPVAPSEKRAVGLHHPSGQSLLRYHRQVSPAIFPDMAYPNFHLFAKPQHTRPFGGVDHANGAETDHTAIDNNKRAHLERFVHQGSEPLALPRFRRMKR